MSCVPVNRLTYVLQSSTKLLQWKMFVPLVFSLYEEHEDTPSGSLVFTVCTCSTFTVPALGLQRAELSAPIQFLFVSLKFSRVLYWRRFGI